MSRCHHAMFALAALLGPLTAPGAARAQFVPPATGVCVLNCGIPAMPAPGGGMPSMGGMGGAIGMMGLGLGVLGILQQLDQPPDTAPAANAMRPVAAPPVRTVAPPPISQAQKAALLGQIRPLGTQAEPASATTTDVEAEKVAILGQIRPTAANPIEGVGVRPGGPDEAASANSQAPFDTAQPNRPAHNAADQLCQAAGKGNGCIGTFHSSGSAPGSTAAPPPNGPAVTPPNPATVAMGGLGNAIVPPRIRGPVCGVTLAVERPVAIGTLRGDPARAAGHPIASSLGQLAAFDYSDIKANLAAMSPQDLARLKLAAQQEIARLDAAADAVRVTLFGAQLGASSPVPSLIEVAKHALYDGVKDAAPFWRQMETLGQGTAQKNLRTAAEKAASETELSEILEGLEPITKGSGSPEVARNYAGSLVEAKRAIDDASKGDNAGASEHGGKAASALLEASEWLLPEAAAETLKTSQGYLAVSLIAVDLSARGYEALATRSESQEARTRNQELSALLAARVDALQGKARDLNKLLDMIAQEPRCR